MRNWWRVTLLRPDGGVFIRLSTFAFRAIRELGYWAVQQLVACLAPMLVCELIVFPTIGWSEYASPLGTIGFQIFEALAIGACGCALGLIMGRDPWTRLTGGWIWLLPAALLAFAMVSDIRSFGPSSILSDYFFDAHPGRTEGPMLREVLTYPAWTSVLYSFGVLFAGRRGRRTKPGDAR